MRSSATPALARRMPAPQARAVSPLEAMQRRLLRFSTAILFASLFLQRFGIPLGSESISVVGPIGLLLAAAGLARGVLAFDPARLAAFLVLTGCAVLGMAWHAVQPGSFDAAPRLQSMLQFLLLSAFATLSFAAPLDETRFYRRVTFVLALIAGAGLLQFAAQFVGVRVFSFAPYLPARLLYEAGYNLEIPVGVGALEKANGFFLVEPSVFSQFMAMALIIEMLGARRTRYLGLFAAGLMASFSGTGWIVLLSFVAMATFSLGLRGLLIAAATLALILLTFGAMMLLAPDLAAAFQDRFAEFSQIGTSAHMRFVTPFWFLHDVLARVPSTALLGMGAGASERLTIPYDYDVNTPIKVGLEYGFPALAAYFCLLGLGRRMTLQGALVVPGLVLLMATGGYQQFPPVLFPILLIISVAWLRPALDTPAMSVAARPAGAR